MASSKKAPHAAGMVPRQRARGRDRGRWEPLPCFGESLHLEGDCQGWLGLLPEQCAGRADGIDGREPRGPLPIDQAVTFIQSWDCSKA
jgi:hypothetical protein